jgi:hypothetical protein
MYIIDKFGKTKKHDIKPDFMLKSVTRENRAALPPRIKYLFFMTLKDEIVPEHLVNDAKKHHPEYFEKL